MIIQIAPNNSPKLSFQRKQDSHSVYAFLISAISYKKKEKKLSSIKLQQQKKGQMNNGLT